MDWHIRYSPGSFPDCGKHWDAIQHAVPNDTTKTFCGRNAYDYWELDRDEFNEPKHVTCKRCRKKMGLPAEGDEDADN